MVRSLIEGSKRREAIGKGKVWQPLNSGKRLRLSPTLVTILSHRPEIMSNNEKLSSHLFDLLDHERMASFARHVSGAVV